PMSPTPPQPTLFPYTTLFRSYGTTMSYGSVTPLNPGMVTAHTVMLSGLAAGTIQHYRVRSKDAAGNQTQSADFTFTTASATSDPDRKSTRLNSSHDQISYAVF